MNTSDNKETIDSNVYHKLIKSLDANLNFDIYLQSIKRCLKKGLSLTPLIKWWEQNNDNLYSNNILIEYTNLLELIKITRPSISPSEKLISPNNSYTTKAKYKHMPWIDDYSKLNSIALVLTNNFFKDYCQYLARYAPRGNPCLNHRKKPIFNINHGSIEHDHLIEMSRWVSGRSAIKNCNLVFDLILGSGEKSSVNSGMLFRAACSCPHKLFQLFMESDFRGIDFNNGEALYFLLLTPLSLNPSDNGPARITPCYPFFNNDIFSGNFTVSPANRKKLSMAWRKFFQRYNALSINANDKRVFHGSAELFELTVNSLKEDSSIPSSIELATILTITKPNIWCVQCWLHTVVLDKNSLWLKSAYFGKEIGIAPDFVGYFFEFANYLFCRDNSDLSSRILITGLINLFFWTSENANEALGFIKAYLPTLYNHRRTDAVLQMQSYIVSNLTFIKNNKNFKSRHINLYNELENIFGTILDQHVCFQKDYNQSKKIKEPLFFQISIGKHNALDIDQNPIEKYILNLIGAALNTNGGDIQITIPLDKKGKPTIDAEHVINAIQHLEYTAGQQKFKYLIAEETISNKNEPIFRIICYRSCQPVFLKRNGTLVFPIFLTLESKPFVLQEDQSASFIAERFIMSDRKKPIELEC